MSHFNVIGIPNQQEPQPQRPGMRRKSSAQNLLSSFKSTTAPAPGPAPPAIQTTNIGTGSISSVTASGLAFATATTPTATTPLVREWDAQSLHSDSVAGSSLAAGATGSPALGQGTSVEYLRDLVQKRIITLTYVRNVHEGRSHWFHTILISRAELDRVFNNNAMKKRTSRFAILGMSLSNLLDINQPQDLLRGLLNTLSEYDQSKEDNDKPKIRLFRSKLAKRQAAGGGFTEYTVSYSDASPDASYLVTPQIPFPLDYHQTLLSLLDVLSEVYNKISKLLGPSPFPHSSQHMMGPLGLLSPHPGVSYIFSENNSANPQYPNQTANSQYPNPNQYSNPSLNQNPMNGEENVLNNSLWGVANASIGGSSGGMGGGVGAFMSGGVLGSPQVTWTPSLGEMVLKIDGKFKKITSTLLKELDAFARNGIKDELASLDPLLRNINVVSPEDGGASGGRAIYDFDGM